MIHPFAIPKGAIIVPVPDAVQSTDYSCGPVSFLSICQYYRIDPPNSEAQCIDMMKINKRIGANPEQITRLARKLRMKYEPMRPMLFIDLMRQLDLGHPVMCTLQAYGGKKDQFPKSLLKKPSCSRAGVL